jgi:hypothetical protein
LAEDSCFQAFPIYSYFFLLYKSYFYFLFLAWIKLNGKKIGDPGAVKKVEEIPLLDLMLPDLNGIEVCEKLKADSVTHSVSIIMETTK